MSWRTLWFLLVVGSLSASLSGCLPSEGRLDEEKDPHFQRGRNLVNAEDYKGAAEEFEQALDNNPRSAAAHFELAWLDDTKLNDYAAAIYHYQRHLQLDPKSPHAAEALDRIRGCKQELANSDFVLPNSQNMQKELDRLNAENLLLRQQVDYLRSQLAAVSHTPPAQPPVQAAPPAQPPPSITQPPKPTPLTAAVVSPAPTPAVLSSAAPARSYVVKPHDTITAIAARYGVKTSMVLAANPSVDPRRLKVGQSLNLP